MQPLELVLVVAGALLLLGAAAMRLGRQRHAPAKPEAAPRSPRRPPAPAPATGAEMDSTAGLPRFFVEEDEELDVTRVTIPTDDDEAGRSEDEETLAREPEVLPIIYDEEAAIDLPTANQAYILVFAAGDSHRGKRRRANEDRFLVLEEPPLFVVADGMGGYAGGEVASGLTVDEVGAYFARTAPETPPYPGIPRRGADVVRAIRRANRRIFEAAEADSALAGMGTTIVCARFSPNKQRVYLGHVGDSRCYLLRDGSFAQVTTDHTAAAAGISGPLGSTLTRALGVRPNVTVDLILGKPRAGDRYLLCSDGLSKMVPDDEIGALLADHEEPEAAVRVLIETANERGGRDNVTVIVIRVDPPPTPPEAQNVTPPPINTS